MSEQQELYDEIVNKSLHLCTDIFSQFKVKDNQLIVNIGNLINNPNFSDVDELRQTLHTFEDKNRLLDILSDVFLIKRLGKYLHRNRNAWLVLRNSVWLLLLRYDNQYWISGDSGLRG